MAAQEHARGRRPLAIAVRSPPVLVRCTAKLLAQLDDRGRPHAQEPPAEDDWYANLLWIDRRKCVLLVHAGTLFAVFAPDVRKADLRAFTALVGGLAADALADEGLPPDTLGALDPRKARVAKTASRNVLGHMTEIAHTCAHAVATENGLAHVDIVDLNRRLRRGLHSRDGDYIRPIELAAARRTRTR